MRLGALLLTPVVLAAQGTLPWSRAPELPWETSQPSQAPPSPLPAVADQQAGASYQVSLSGDGTLHISDVAGRVLLRLGLSGRPLRILKDAGEPMTLADFPSQFPTKTPLSRGLGTLPLAEGDFRGALQGLLWILDDGERRLTLVHPATQRVVYLPLPAGQNWEFSFQPDRLELRERTPGDGATRDAACWSLSWFVLLPQLVGLSLPPPPRNQGTAFRPFPPE